MFASKIVAKSLSAEEEERSLAVICRVILEEVGSTASAEQYRGFLVAIGRRLSALVSMPDNSDLEMIEQRANELWSGLGWGSVGFEIDDEGIEIVHRGLPETERNHLQKWEELLPPLLEGAYDAWFSQFGAEDRNLSTRVVRRRPGEVDLRYGL